MIAPLPPDRSDEPHSSNDYHTIPATQKQLRFARSLARSTGQTLPWSVQQDRHALSRWIDEQRNSAAGASRFSHYPTSRQVAFAERLAAARNRRVPPECFQDRKLMSRWIDGNR